MFNPRPSLSTIGLFSPTNGHLFLKMSFMCFREKVSSGQDLLFTGVKINSVNFEFGPFSGHIRELVKCIKIG